MLASFKRWFSRDAAAQPWAELQAWAMGRGWRFARAKEGEGLVIEGQMQDRPWRLEWGPPQRAYVSGRELRIRMELGLPLSLQMLLMSRALMESLESEVFERSTQDLQTHVDMSTPEEMRWLSMFAKSTLTQRPLRAHFGGVSNPPALLEAWIDEALAARLFSATAALLQAGPPFLLMTLRGRLYLRMQLPAIAPGAVEQALGIFEAAVPASLGVAASVRAEGEAAASSVSTAWQSEFPAGPGKG